jgi:hypothetical protein
MTNTFAQLKKANSLESLTQELEKLTKETREGASGPDERLWKLTVDKAQNGHAVIRFLPAPKGESLPWVRVFSHGFQGPGNKWFIEECPTTVNQKCPVCEANTELWNTGVEANKQIARDRKRKLQYISNIQVVSDPGNADNEGKVFLFRYGKKIYDMIQDVMRPEFEDEVAINPFEFWEGANFRLRARKVAGYRSYDKSEFDSVSVLSDDDSVLEEVWNSQHSLEEFVALEQFKSYDDLKTRFSQTMGVPSSFEDHQSAFDNTPERTPVAAPEVDSDEDDDDSLSYFKKLAEEV